MTNQTCTKPRVDAAKKRRRYLQETYISRVALASGCALGLLCATLLFVLASTYYSTDPGTIRMVNSTPWLYWSWGAFIDLASGPAPVVSSLCIVGLSSIFLSYSSARRLKTIPYVPPVAEQIAALPAGQLLLRGSDQPAAASGELVRASSYTKENRASELLRAEPSIQNRQECS